MFEILSILMFHFLIGKVRNVVQVLQPWIQSRKIEYVKLKRVILELLSRYLKKYGPGMLLLRVDGELNVETIQTLVFFLINLQKLFNFFHIYLFLYFIFLDMWQAVFYN